MMLSTRDDKKILPPWWDLAVLVADLVIMAGVAFLVVAFVRLYRRLREGWSQILAEPDPESPGEASQTASAVTYGNIGAPAPS
jgi:hypothetical protein